MRRILILIITAFSLISVTTIEAQTLEVPGYRFIKRVRGIKIIDSKIEEMAVFEKTNHFVVSYRSKKILYLSIFQMGSWDKYNDYRLDGLVELYNSYFSEDGKYFFANIDLYKQIYLKIKISSGEVDTLQCAETPLGCNKVEQQLYQIEKYTSSKELYILRDKDYPNDYMVYMDMYKFNKVKDEMEAQLGTTVTVQQVKDKMENDARKKWGMVSAPAVAVTGSSVASKKSIVLTKEDIETLLKTGTLDKAEMTVQISQADKKIIQETYIGNTANAGASHTSNKPATISGIKIEVGEVVKLNNIQFEQGKYTLNPSSYTELNNIVNIMNAYPTLQIQVNGHTNNVGTQNLEYSEKRAKAVVDYVISKGISANRLAYKGFGDTLPIASNDTPEGKEMNRRVEFVIIKK